MEIKHYNPILGIRLKDLKLLAGMANGPVKDILMALIKSVEGNTRYFVDNQLAQLTYENIIDTMEVNAKAYDEFLVEKLGYDVEDVQRFHRRHSDEVPSRSNDWDNNDIL